MDENARGLDDIIVSAMPEKTIQLDPSAPNEPFICSLTFVFRG